MRPRKPFTHNCVSDSTAQAAVLPKHEATNERTISASNKVVKHEPEEGRSPLHGVKTLVVDDEKIVLLAMTAALESWGCEIQCAETLEQAVEKFECSEPDIILCDYRLHQNYNGVQMVGQLRERFSTDTPAIIISGDRSNNFKDALANTDLGLLAKPIYATDLLAIILDYLD